MEWMILPLRRYAQFSGRSQRKEYWLFVLLNVIVSIMLNLVDSALGLGGHTANYATQSANRFAAGAYTRGGLLSTLWSFGILLPSLAVGVRRLHDIDRTGWWLVAPVVAVAVGAVFMLVNGIAGGLLIAAGVVVAILLFVWACFDGTPGGNRFGPNPKGTITDLQETFR